MGITRAATAGPTGRGRRPALVAAAALLLTAVTAGTALRGDEGVRAVSPVGRDEPLDLSPRTDDVVWAAERGSTASARVAEVEPAATLPLAVQSLKDPHTGPLPAWSAFDLTTGGFLWTDVPSDPGLGFVGPRAFTIRSPAADSGLVQVSCAGMCSDVLSFGPAPDEVTVLVMDTVKEPVNPRPASLARVYGLDGSVRDELDLAEVMGTERRVSDETGDWVPPDGSEALIADIEWAPDGTRLAVSTHPGFFEPGCPPAALPCEAMVWNVDRDGGDPVPVHREASREQSDGVGRAPVLTGLAWTSDSSRLGLVLLAHPQARAEHPPSLLAMEVESGRASILHEFSDCGECRTVRHGFAWSPDGSRLAVTSGDGISVLDTAGTVLSESSEGGPGPLAWLPRAH